ncbi:MAG TPA: hypothetical protein VKA46_03220 [Gemmataceae bacterium]|nr:hypothetical protein [Gemmataceae bacterium]
MAATTGYGTAGRKARKRRLCGLPAQECRGDAGGLSPGLSGLKSHATAEEAFECYRAWLLRQGYRQVGGREFEAPRAGRIVVLTKKSRFGALLRGGKEGRHMPAQFPGGAIVC